MKSEAFIFCSKVEGAFKEEKPCICGHRETERVFERLDVYYQLKDLIAFKYFLYIKNIQYPILTHIFWLHNIQLEFSTCTHKFKQIQVVSVSQKPGLKDF